MNIKLYLVSLLLTVVNLNYSYFKRVRNSKFQIRALFSISLHFYKPRTQKTHKMAKQTQTIRRKIADDLF